MAWWYLILCDIAFLVCVYIYHIVRKRYKLINRCKNEHYRVASLGNTISVVALQGGGKTTTLAILNNYLTLYLIDKLQNKMAEIVTKLKELDFNELDKEIAYMLEIQAQMINRGLMSNYNIEGIKRTINDKYQFATYYSNFLSIEHKGDLLAEYIHCFYIINIRKKFVHSSTYFYNAITGENSLSFNPNNFSFKKARVNKNWAGDYYTIFAVDEENAHHGNVYSNDKAYKLEGITESLQKIRNAGQGTIYYIVAKQVHDDQIKAYRSLFQSNLEIYDNITVCDFLFLRKVLKWLRCKGIYIFFRLHHLFCNSEKYLELKAMEQKRTSKRRNLSYRLLQIEALLWRNGFKRIRYKNYFNPEDYGKKDDIYYERFVLYAPLYYCYGSFDTYYFSFLIDEMNKSYASNKSTLLTSRFEVDKKQTQYDELMRGE